MFMKKQEENSQKNSKKQKLYTKDVVLKSKRFAKYKDAFAATLDKNKCYSLVELEEILKRFKKPK